LTDVLIINPSRQSKESRAWCFLITTMNDAKYPVLFDCWLTTRMPSGHGDGDGCIGLKAIVSCPLCKRNTMVQNCTCTQAWFECTEITPECTYWNGLQWTRSGEFEPYMLGRCHIRAGRCSQCSLALPQPLLVLRHLPGRERKNHIAVQHTNNTKHVRFLLSYHVH
jgi:hypothetical protein